MKYFTTILFSMQLFFVYSQKDKDLYILFEPTKDKMYYYNPKDKYDIYVFNI